MNGLTNLLIYAGLDKARFDALKPEANRESRKSLRLYSLFAAILFGVLAVIVWLSGVAPANKAYYAALAVFNAGVYICISKTGARTGKLVMPMAYASVVALYAVAIGLTLLHAELPAVTIIAVMLLTPFIFADSPVYIIAINCAATLAMCLLCVRFKARAVAVIDCWNAVSFCVVSIVVSLMQSRLRFRALAQDREIRFLSETDLMTGTRNRNVFERLPNDYSERCERTLTCVYADVNGLHAMNEREGHKAGDVMLQTVAGALLERFGAEHVYRIGGDEFVAFAADASEADVRADLRRIGSALAAKGYDISVGIASAERGAMGLQRLLDDAEQEMYRQKQAYYRQPGHERRRR